jgi:hypothetical protein
MYTLRLQLLLLLLLMAGACATSPTERPPQPPSSPAVQAELGYREVLQAGEEYARLQGYALAGPREAVELRPNYWRLRFGLAESHSGKLLDLEFDGTSRSVVRQEVIPEPVGEPVPSRNP